MKKMNLFHELKLVGAVGAENEFPLEKDRFNLPWGKEKVSSRKSWLSLQTDF